MAALTMAAPMVVHGRQSPEMRMDARVELLAVVMRLAGDLPRPAVDAGAYGAATASHFESFHAHRAVSLVKTARARGGAEHALTELLLRLSPPPVLRPTAPLPPELIRRLGGEEAVERLLEGLRDFSTAARHADFFRTHAKDHERFVAAARKEAERAQDLEPVRAYLGEPSKTYSIIISPLFPRDFSAMISEAGAYVAVRGPAGSSEGRARFMLDAFGNSPAHELVHFVADPLAFRLEAFGRAGLPPKGCNDQQTRSWRSCFQEHVALAVTLRSAALESGEEASVRLSEQYAKGGFPFIPILCERLKEYEADRARYPALAAFFSRLAGAFLDAAGGPKLESVMRAEELKNKGRDAFLVGNSAEALEHFRAAARSTPGDPEIEINMAVACDVLGRSREAMGHYSEAVRLAEADLRMVAFVADGLSSRAGLLERLGRKDEARGDLERALKVAPAGWARESDVRRSLERLQR